MKAEGIFQFREFAVDASARTLRRDGEIVTLNRRAFDVLLYLVQNPGRLLTREELLKNVWSDTFVDENSLAQSMSALRRALEEKPGDNTYIATLPGRGYQFIAPVQVTAPESLSLVTAGTAEAGNTSGGLVFQRHTVQTSIITQEAGALQGSTTRARLIPLGVFVLAVASVGFYAWSRIHKATPPPAIARAPARRSIAVLGFRNLSGRPEEAWVSTALAEMLSTELVAGEKLRLVSGEDIARTKLELPLADADSLSRETLARLHRNLDSDLIVLGSYTALGEKPDTRIRIDLRLQDTAVGETVADIAVVGNEANLFDVVAEAGAQLREKLGVQAVSPVEAVSVRASLPANREAARLYSEGLARLRLFDALAARDLLQQAIAADPKFALAHSALAEAWFRMGYDKKAQAEARQAYDLSANLSREEKLLVEGRYRETGHESDRAIEVYRSLFTLFPDNVDYGLKLAWVQTFGAKAHDALSTLASLRKLATPASDDPRIDLVEAWAWDALSDRKREQQVLSQAVEKAREQGSRLILADARRVQCAMFGYYLGQLENALAACREALDLYTAAGDKQDAAKDLATLAAIDMSRDAPESIRLGQQALAIFREVGNVSGATSALMGLGIAYGGQGDFATAEKLEREALANDRLLDSKRGEAKGLGNIAILVENRGDLRGAIQLFEESTTIDPEDTGRAILAHLNIAGVHQLQGDLAGAKQGFEQSITAFQGVGDKETVGVATFGLASVLLEQGDLPGSRKMYEQSLSIRTAAGDKLTIAETQLGLAELSLEESRSPAEQETAVRQVIDVFQQQKSRDDETGAWWILVRALLAEGKVTAAKEAVQHALSLAAKSQNPEIRWRTAISAAQVANADKTTGSAAGIAARKELASVIAKSRELGYRIVELDARLALAEIEIKAGQTAAGRAHLNAIEADAKATGYLLVARKAAVARG
ncbi:MAG TPA: tetratricopeptide repeat protein [Terriglobales bacterium]|nr:tetratricopeptide repeat protein [Terriglobales bacterium]